MRIQEHFTNIGSRDENLDLLVTLGTSDCNELVLLFDGYDCSVEQILLAAREIQKVFNDNDHLSPEDILNLASLEHTGIKASLVMLLKEQSQLCIFSSGDCRAYSLKHGLITTDHTEAWRKLESTGLTKNKIQTLVQYEHSRNILLQSVKSTNSSHEGDSYQIALTDGSHILLCSDGFWEHFESDTHIKLLTVAHYSA